MVNTLNLSQESRIVILSPVPNISMARVWREGDDFLYTQPTSRSCFINFNDKLTYEKASFHSY